MFCCRVGHNEVIGVCRVGNEAESLGRDHWSEMLTYPRKPIAHWHPLIEVGLLVQKTSADVLKYSYDMKVNILT